MSENPKAAPGRRKFDFSVLPFRVIAELSVAMLEGALKYGRFNWRTCEPILVSTYIAALNRHITCFVEGENIDPDSGRHHLIKAMATLVVLFDAWLFGNVVDDRPPPQPNQDWQAELNEATTALRERYPEKK